MTLYIAKFIGYCNIAISEDKEIVKEYVKNIRKLNKDEYKIFEKDIPEEDRSIYDDRPEFISEEHGLIYTNLDWYILRQDFGFYIKDLIITRNTIEETLFNMSKLLSKSGEDSLQESLDEINDLLRRVDKPGKERDTIEKEFYKKHEINFMNIIAYLSYTQLYEDKYTEYVENVYFPRF